MDIFSGKFPSLVFKGSIKGDLDEFSLDSQMLKVLMVLDGKKSVASVSKSTHMSMGTLKKVLTRLNNIQLIEKAENSLPVLQEAFFSFLTAHLSKALGPIATFLVEDEIRELGDDPARVPVHRAAELVNMLARQIPRKEKRVAFQQAMAQKIKETIV